MNFHVFDDFRSVLFVVYRSIYLLNGTDAAVKLDFGFNVGQEIDCNFKILNNIINLNYHKGYTKNRHSTPSCEIRNPYANK